METNAIQPDFETVTEAIAWLQGKGYQYDFKLDTDCIGLGRDRKLYPEDFRIDYTFRFEGMTDPGDESVVYAITASADALRGILVSAYGAYSDPVSERMISKLSGRR